VVSLICLYSPQSHRVTEKTLNLYEEGFAKQLGFSVTPVTPVTSVTSVVKKRDQDSFPNVDRE
jgi:hypothetical protein